MEEVEREREVDLHLRPDLLRDPPESPRRHDRRLEPVKTVSGRRPNGRARGDLRAVVGDRRDRPVGGVRVLGGEPVRQPGEARPGAVANARTAALEEVVVRDRGVHCGACVRVVEPPEPFRLAPLEARVEPDGLHPFVRRGPLSEVDPCDLVPLRAAHQLVAPIGRVFDGRPVDAARCDTEAVLGEGQQVGHHQRRVRAVGTVGRGWVLPRAPCAEARVEGLPALRDARRSVRLPVSRALRAGEADRPRRQARCRREAPEGDGRRPHPAPPRLDRVDGPLRNHDVELGRVPAADGADLDDVGRDQEAAVENRDPMPGRDEQRRGRSAAPWPSCCSRRDHVRPTREGGLPPVRVRDARYPVLSFEPRPGQADPRKVEIPAHPSPLTSMSRTVSP